MICYGALTSEMSYAYKLYELRFRCLKIDQLSLGQGLYRKSHVLFVRHLSWRGHSCLCSAFVDEICVASDVNFMDQVIIKMKRQRWPEMAGEDWNPVCCYGNQTVELILWSTFCRNSLQRIKLFWDKFRHIWSKFDWMYDVMIGHDLKLEYLWNEKRYLNKVNSILLFTQDSCLCFKRLR